MLYPLIGLPWRPVPVIPLQLRHESARSDGAPSVRLDDYRRPAGCFDFVKTRHDLNLSITLFLYTVDSLRDLINTGSSYRSGAPTQHNDYSEAGRYL